MDLNALGQALGAALQSGWQGYAWMKEQDQQKARDQERIQQQAEQQRRMEEREAQRQKADELERFDAKFDRVMTDFGKQADAARLKADEDAGFESALSSLPADRQPAIRAARAAGVKPSLEMFLPPKPGPLTSEQEIENRVALEDALLRTRAKYEKPERPPKPEQTGLSSGDRMRLEQWKAERLASIDADTELPQSARDAARTAILDAYRGAIGTPPIAPAAPMPAPRPGPSMGLAPGASDLLHRFPGGGPVTTGLQPTTDPRAHPAVGRTVTHKGKRYRVVGVDADGQAMLEPLQ